MNEFIKCSKVVELVLRGQKRKCNNNKWSLYFISCMYV